MKRLIMICLAVAAFFTGLGTVLQLFQVKSDEVKPEDVPGTAEYANTFKKAGKRYVEKEIVESETEDDGKGEGLGDDSQEA